MKKTISFFAAFSFFCIIIYSFSALDQRDEPRQSSLVQIDNVFEKGAIPINIGMPDTIIIPFGSNSVSGSPFHFVISVYGNNTHEYDTTISFPRGIYKDTLRCQLRREYQPKSDLIVVRALAGEFLNDYLIIDTLYDSSAYCQDITIDAYNYAEPCRNAAGGFGIRGATGNFVAQFRNNDSNSIVIGSIKQSFFDSVGSGNKPYNIVIYGDSGNSKPGSLKYISPNLTTPSGTGAANNVTYVIDSLVTIPANSRFYVGYRQTSVSRINASFQNESPIRRNAFFFTSSNSGNTWRDFADSAYNNRFDISPILGKTKLNLNYILQGHYDDGIDQLNPSDTISVYLRNSFSPYVIVDSAKGKIDVDSAIFKKSFSFNKVITGNYYIAVKHRNSIETWSNSPVSFMVSGSTNYNFTTAANKAYGNNLAFVGNSRYGAFAGDINQDGFVDLTDVVLVFNAASAFVTGYVVTDVNGDEFCDLTDLVYTFNNSSIFAQKVTP